MGDYIFNVYLHTDKGEFNHDYSLSEYFFNLPPFYFILNEYISAKAEINIDNSMLMCTGTNIYYQKATLSGGSIEICDAAKTIYHSYSVVYMQADSKALLEANSVKYVDIRDTVFARCYAVAVFD